jgi:hypothetical protein
MLISFGKDSVVALPLGRPIYSSTRIEHVLFDPQLSLSFEQKLISDLEGLRQAYEKRFC